MVALEPMSPKYSGFPPHPSNRSWSNSWKSDAEGWWMVHRIACPLFASFLRSLQVDHAVWLSKPEVGSSVGKYKGRHFKGFGIDFT